MERYPRLFIQTALIYLLIGVILGVVIGTDPMLAVRFRFVHIHLNLLGFMVMFIAGVAYHVLPRFTARTMPWPAGVKYHFYLQNVGLLGMLGAKLMDDIWTAGGKTIFVLFAVVTASGLFIMICNLFCVLMPRGSTCEHTNESLTHPRKACEEDCSP
jgi:cbb3-type cytochrome oxidase subunit 1